jgi:endonuclease G
MKIIPSLFAFAFTANIFAGGLEIHSHHCLFGCPVGNTDQNDLIIREIYILSNDDDSNFADWAAYKVTRDTIGKSHKRVWRSDPWLEGDETLEPADYKGANKALGTDRGHQVPLASFSATPQWATTNYLSNITPQLGPLNQGPWKNLESAVRKLALLEGTEGVYVMTGPLFEGNTPEMPHADEESDIPSGYWKVVAIEDGKTVKVASFIMPQEAQRKDDFCTYIVPLDEVEERSGYGFYHHRNKRKDVEQSTAPIGCP